MIRVITIAREFGSGGRMIGKLLSEDLGWKYYDKDLIKLASDASGINEAFFGLVDEKLKGSWLRRGGSYTGVAVGPNDKDYTSDANLFHLTAQVIQELADREPAIIVGRCADYILKDRPDVLRILIHSDSATAVETISNLYGTDRRESERMIERVNQERGEYYKHYTNQDWLNAENYDVCLSTSSMTPEQCVSVLKFLIAQENQ